MEVLAWLKSKIFILENSNSPSSTKTNLFVYYFREEKNKIKEFNKLIENKKYAKKFTGRLYRYNKKCLNQNHFIKNQVMKMIEEKNLFK